MSDIAQLLEHVAEQPRDLDLDRVHRDGRRRRRRPRVVAGAVVAVVAIAAVSVFAVVQDDRDASVHSPATQPTAGSTPSTTPVVPPVEETTTVPTTVPVSSEPLTTESKLGFSGLGPLRLGMSFPDAERAAQVELQNSGCGYSVVPGGADIGVGVDVLSGGEPLMVRQIEVRTPAISTISGIHLGSSRADVLATYPYAVSQPTGEITITSDEDRTITFFFSIDDEVALMTLSQGQRIVVDPNC